jgi:hypothetical protein
MLRDLRCATFVDAPGTFQRSFVAVKGQNGTPLHASAHGRCTFKCGRIAAVNQVELKDRTLAAGSQHQRID